MASDKAFMDEEAAYNAIKKKLGSTASVFQSPAGAATGFPDFGFVVTAPMGNVALHIEYKNSSTAQMGSMRDWIFDGTSFSTNDKKNEEKLDLIYIMNNTSTAITNGKRLLKDLQTFCTKDIKSISSSSLTIIKDQIFRKKALTDFAKNTKNYQIANITDATLGTAIINHYKNKFKKSKNAVSAKGHVLLMLIKDELWYVDKTNVNDSTMSQIANLLGVKSINKLSGLTANLEVRIQPRGLNSPGKPASIDVMASFRLKGKPSSGVTVI